MSVYFKFKSAKDYDAIPIDGHFITVGNLKEKIFESKHLGRGTDFDLVVTNAQTNEEYLDEDTLIPKNTSVLIRRVPGRPRMPIVTAPVTELDEPQVEYQTEEAQTVKSSVVGGESSATKYNDDLDWDEFGNDLYAIPEATPVPSSNQVQDAPPPSKADEESKIKALIDTPALDWQSQPSDGFGAGRGYGRGPGGRMMGGRGGRGFGWGGGLERKTPPPGYICHRCKVPGHFIQHCPTNGDPNFDIRKVKPPTGIPKSMLMATPDGSYSLPSGANAVLKPNEAAFEREVEGMPSIRSVGDLPPELHCPLCKEVMKDAVLTSKCCFTSFCDKCIRDYIISKSVCVCGATNILADDLLPNKTLRDTINRILESNNSSAEHGGSALQVQDMESARNPPPKIPSPAQSAASKGELLPPPPPPDTEENSKPQESAGEVKDGSAPQQMLDRGRTSKVADVSEATRESLSVKEHASQGSAPLVDEEVQQKAVVGEAGKKKKKKKTRLPLNPAAAEMQWRAAQDLATENYMMSMGPSAYNPYWTGMQPGLDGFGGPYPGAMPYNPYGPGPLDVPFMPPVVPHDPFGGQGFMMPFGPPMQRDLAADFGMGFNAGPPIMSREEFEARKADLRRKREIDRRGEREFPKDREHAREVGSAADGPSLKPKSKAIPPPSSSSRPRQPERPSPDLDHHRRRERPSPDHDRHRRPERPSPDLDHHRRPERPSPDLDHHRRPERASPDLDYHRRPERLSPDHRSRDPELPRPSSKRKHEDYDDHHHEDRHRHDHHEDRHHRDHSHRSSSSHHRSESSASAKPSSTGPSEPPLAVSSKSADKKKASVFSRICFPAEESAAASKKRKVSSSSEVPISSSASHRGATSNGYHEEYRAATGSRKSAAASVDYESSDDDRHFKRRPSRYEPSPPLAAVDWEEEERHRPPPRHSKGSRERGLR
ncbi:E3 ubiquitin ligase PQT3-like isoform X2 [Lycium barbarum]|uniref:E3 ubiquitin ligase PQT3-like isoform X2 n=1 Tax=Lycium barbarum TaxID=112863 RepID=UPI00293E3728|nr:E3 ubiquitin ligase PQT3-like isoform X2 [Lycium barbarum]